jgi:hypothetical protein
VSGSDMDKAELLKMLKKKPDLHDLLERTKANPELIPGLLEIMRTEKGSVKFSCEKIIRLLSAKFPELVYPYFNDLADLLASPNNIIKWGAIITLANLATADRENKFARIYEQYFFLLNDASMITAGNVAGNAWKIVLNNPGYEKDITERLLTVQNNVYLNKGRPSPECQNIMFGHVLDCFDKYYPATGEKEKILEFVASLRDNPRPAVAKRAEAFLQPLALEKIASSKTIIVAPESASARISHSGSTVFLKAGDEADIGGLKIVAVPAYNTAEGHSTKKFHHQGDSLGYVLQFPGKRVYFAGDTDFIPEMKNLQDIDIAFLPVGGTYVMDMEEAVEAAVAFRPKIVIPMHQGHDKPEDFKKEVQQRSETSGIELVILDVGDKVSI